MCKCVTQWIATAAHNVCTLLQPVGGIDRLHKRPAFPLLLSSQLSHAIHTKIIVSLHTINASFIYTPGHGQAYGKQRNIENTPKGYNS